MVERWPARLAIGVLLICILPWSYPIYALGKIVVFGIAIYYAHYRYHPNQTQDGDFWKLVIIALLFNPLLPIHLYFSLLWIIADIVIAGYFYVYQQKVNK